MALSATGLVQSFRLTNPNELGVLPTIELFKGATPVSLDTIRDLANYTLSNNGALTSSGGTGGSNIQSRPWTAIDQKYGAHADYTYKGFEKGKVPVTVMVGGSVDRVERTIDRPDYRYTLAATTGSALDALKDPLYVRDVALGFGSYEAMDPYLVYQLVQPTTSTLNAVDNRRFDEENDALYLRLDAKINPNFLLVGGVRYEKRTMDAYGVTGTPVRARASTSLVDFDSYYPSINFKYTPKRNIVVRGGYSQTIGVPDYGDVLPIFTASSTPTANDGVISVPEANLKPFRTNNYDLSVEYYLKNSGVVSLAAYRKDVSDFIISRSMTAAETAAVLASYGLNPADFGSTTGTTRENGPDTESLQGARSSATRKTCRSCRRLSTA